MPKGGARPGAGRPKKPLGEKLAAGNPGKRPLKVVEFEKKRDDYPPPADHLDILGSGSEFYPSASKIYENTAEWLAVTGCRHLVSPQLVEDYALNTNRRLWAEYEVVRRGLVHKDPKRERMVMNEFVKTSQIYYKLAADAWDKIWRIVAANCEKDLTIDSPGTEFLKKIYGVKINTPLKPIEEDDDDEDEY